MTNKGIVMERVFDAPVEKVWKTWTTPELVKKWWGPKDFTAPHIEIDLREGGKYLYCMRGQSGPDAPVRDYWSAGVFKEVEVLKKIVATDYFSDEKGNPVTPAYYGLGSDNPFEMTVEVMFRGRDGKTELTVRYPDTSRLDEKDISDMRMGWNESLDRFEEALKKV